MSEELNQDDLDTLVKLLLRSQQSRERKALCINIGIDHQQLNFIENTSDRDFFIRLVNHLHVTDDRDTFCNLCYKELLHSLPDQETKHLLEKIIERLGCVRPIITQKPITIFPKKNIFIINAILVVIVLTVIGFTISKQISGKYCADVSSNSSQKPSSTKVQILNLHDNKCVDESLTIKGKVTVQEAKEVWIVVKPVTDSKYYVQPAATREDDGTFEADVYVGDNNTPSNTEFRIRAFAFDKPNHGLKEGDKLDSWPKAKLVSDTILVKRK